MAVAAVTLSCNGGAQTKLSLERVVCPPLDPKPHQHLRHLPWSGISQRHPYLLWEQSLSQGGASPKLGQAQLLPDPVLSLSPLGWAGRPRP